MTTRQQNVRIGPLVVLAAEEVLSVARQVIASVSPSAVARSQLLGLLDARLTHHVLQKPDPHRRTFLSPSHIGWQMVQGINLVYKHVGFVFSACGFSI